MIFLANWILRMVIDGKVLLSWKPPRFYEAHPQFDDMHACLANYLRHEEKPERPASHVDSEQEEMDSSTSRDDSENVFAGAGGAFSALLDASEDSE
jgi:hypothetical protein